MRSPCVLLSLLTGCHLIFPLEGEIAGDAGPPDGPDLPGPCSPISTINDSFDGAISDRWRVGVVGDGAVMPVEGKAVFTALNGLSRATLEAAHYFDLREGAVTVDVEPASPLLPTTRFELTLVGEAPFGVSPPTAVLGLRRESNVDTLVGEREGLSEFSRPYDPSADRVWRISRVGDEVRWETAPVREGPFVLAGTSAMPGFSFVRVSLGLSGEDQGQVTFRVDQVNDATPAVMCPIATLRDRFPGPELSPQWSSTLMTNCVPDFVVDGIELQPTVSGSFCALQTSSLYDMSAGSLELEVISVAGVADQDFDLQLGAGGDTIGFFLQQNVLRAVATRNGQTEVYDSLNFVLDEHRFLRLRDAGGGNLAFEHSADGQAYTTLADTLDFSSVLDRVDVRITLSGGALEPATVRRVNN